MYPAPYSENHDYGWAIRYSRAVPPNAVTDGPGGALTDETQLSPGGFAHNPHIGSVQIKIELGERFSKHINTHVYMYTCI